MDDYINYDGELNCKGVGGAIHFLIETTFSFFGKSV